MRSLNSQMDEIAKRHERSRDSSSVLNAATDKEMDNSMIVSVLAVLSALLGIFNPKIIEWVLWYSGNPLPYGSQTTMLSAFCALISAVAGTIAIFTFENSRSDSTFRYVALVGAGVSYPFIMYYSISVIAIFSQLSRIK